MTELEVTIRPIRSSDDPHVARLIREVMTEFDCVGPGYAIVDPEVDAMTAAYPRPDARFYVVAQRTTQRDAATEIVGCGGFAPLLGVPREARIAELRKMYFRKVARGRGIGSQLLTLLLDEMRAAGFTSCYLETTTRMEAARALYARHGFAEHPGPLGATGHTSCERHFLRAL